MSIENLQREVTEARGAAESAIVLIEGLRDQLDAIVDSSESYEQLQAQVEALSADLSASTDKLAAAVVEPADPAPAEPVTP